MFRKPTFTGQYIRWDAFSPQIYKINLIKSLVHRAVRICTPDKLENEIDQLCLLFANNGYPPGVVTGEIKRTLTPGPPKFGPRRCPIYLRLPWIGTCASKGFERQVQRAVRQAYYACELHVVFTSRHMFRSTIKDRLPTQQLSNVIYLFRCRCDRRYVGKTTQHLMWRIKQHVPTGITAASGNTTTSMSAIGEHLLANPTCAEAYSEELFSILHQDRSRRVLDVLQALAISNKKPELCKQLQFIKHIHLFRTSYDSNP